MFGLPSLTIWSKLAIFAAWTVTVALVIGVKVDEYVSSKYEAILLNEKVHLVERTNTITVLDEKTLQASLKRERAKWDKEQENKNLVEDIIHAHEADGKPWCGLSADELRQWNEQNSELVGDTTSGQPEPGPKVPDPRTGEDGSNRGSVAQ